MKKLGAKGWKRRDWEVNLVQGRREDDGSIKAQERKIKVGQAN